MTIGRNEIEMLRDELYVTFLSRGPSVEIDPAAINLREAIRRMTEDWTAYRVRTYDHGRLEERWQIRSSWRPVIVDGTQGTITGRMHTKKPAIQDAGPSRRLQRPDEEKP